MFVAFVVDTENVAPETPRLSAAAVSAAAMARRRAPDQSLRARDETMLTHRRRGMRMNRPGGRGARPETIQKDHASDLKAWSGVLGLPPLP